MHLKMADEAFPSFYPAKKHVDALLQDHTSVVRYSTGKEKGRAN
jgi:hypothetical protein